MKNIQNFKHIITEKLTHHNKSENENLNLQNKITLLENEILQLKELNKELKDDTKNDLKIIKTLSEGQIIDPPWQTVCSKKINSTSSKVNHQHQNNINLCNSYESLEVEDIGFSSCDSEVESTQRKNRKARSNRTKNKDQIKNKHLIYNDTNKNNFNNNITAKLFPGNRSYADATKYGKKVVIFWDSHLNSYRQETVQ